MAYESIFDFISRNSVLCSFLIVIIAILVFLLIVKRKASQDKADDDLQAYIRRQNEEREQEAHALSRSKELQRRSGSGDSMHPPRSTYVNREKHVDLEAMRMRLEELARESEEGQGEFPTEADDDDLHADDPSAMGEDTGENMSEEDNPRLIEELHPRDQGDDGKKGTRDITEDSDIILAGIIRKFVIGIIIAILTIVLLLLIPTILGVKQEDDDVSWITTEEEYYEDGDKIVHVEQFDDMGVLREVDEYDDDDLCLIENYDDEGRLVYRFIETDDMESEENYDPENGELLSLNQQYRYDDGLGNDMNSSHYVTREFEYEEGQIQRYTLSFEEDFDEPEYQDFLQFTVYVDADDQVQEMECMASEGSDIACVEDLTMTGQSSIEEVFDIIYDEEGHVYCLIKR